MGMSKKEHYRMDAEELVAVVRDLTIIVFAMIGVLVMLVATVIGLLLYKKISPALDSAKATLKNTQEVTAHLSEKVVKPLMGTSSMTFNAGRVVAFILGLSRGKGGRKNGK